MKAQSDLTGDREKRAEMPRPRFSGATKWMSSINTMRTKTTDLTGTVIGGGLDHDLMDSLTKYTGIGTSLGCGLADFGGGINDSASDLLGTYKTFGINGIENEVKHRPAVWQQTVCTP